MQAVLPPSALSRLGSGPPPLARLGKQAGRDFLRCGTANFFVRRGSKQRTSMMAGIGTVNVDIAIASAYPPGSQRTWPPTALWVHALQTSSKAQAHLPASAHHNPAALREQLSIIAEEGKEETEVTFAEICTAACAGGDAARARLRPMRKTLLQVAHAACRAAEAAATVGLPGHSDAEGVAGGGLGPPVAGGPGRCGGGAARAGDGANHGVSAQTADATRGESLPPNGSGTASCSVRDDRAGGAPDLARACVDATQRAPGAPQAEATCSSAATAGVSAPWCDADFERGGLSLGQGQTARVELAYEVPTQKHVALKVRRLPVCAY